MKPKNVELLSGCIILGSYGCMSTGVNIPNLHNIIFASPSKSRIRVLQSIGRGLRRTEEKSTMTLFDIADDLRTGKPMNYLLQHYIERLKIYDEEQFTYQQYYIDLTK
jgi:superfamily II DNA or RNA helicase